MKPEKHYNTDLSFLNFSVSAITETTAGMTTTVDENKHEQGTTATTASVDVSMRQHYINLLSQVPVVVIQSTEDSFFNPRNVEYLKDPSNIPFAK